MIPYAFITKSLYIHSVFFPQPGEVGKGDPKYYKYFFASRFVAAPLGSRAEDYPDSNLENEVDKAHQDEFVTFVRERYNFEVDRSRLHFGCFKDHHPESDPTHAGVRKALMHDFSRTEVEIIFTALRLSQIDI